MKKYYAEFSKYATWGVAEIEVEKETDKTLVVSGFTPIYGSIYYVGKKLSKDKGNTFDQLDEALDWLVDRSQEHIEKCQNSLDNAYDVYDKLITLGE